MKFDCEQFTLQPLSAQREWTFENFPVLRAQISLLEPSSPDAWRNIRRFYRLQSRAFLKYCQGEVFPWARKEAENALSNSVPAVCFEAELSAQTTYQSGQLWSLYTQTRDTAFPGAPTLHRWGDTWNLSTGYPIRLNAFFPPRSHWKKRFLSAVAAQIRRQEQHGLARYHPGWQKLIKRYFSPHNFYLTPEGIAIFYPMYAIAPAAEKIPVFVLPYDGEPPLKPLR